jgi:DNA-binding response OmpR family regulator
MNLLTFTAHSQPIEALTLGDADRHLNTTDTRIDLVILAVDLLDGDGPNFCARLRYYGHRMPIMGFQAQTRGIFGSVYIQ